MITRSAVLIVCPVRCYRLINQKEKKGLTLRGGQGLKRLFVNVGPTTSPRGCINKVNAHKHTQTRTVLIIS